MDLRDYEIQKLQDPCAQDPKSEIDSAIAMHPEALYLADIWPSKDFVRILKLIRPLSDLEKTIVLNKVHVDLPPHVTFDDIVYLAERLYTVEIDDETLDVDDVISIIMDPVISQKFDRELLVQIVQLWQEYEA